MKIPSAISARREHYKKRFEDGKMSHWEYEVTLSKIDKREILLVKRANDKIELEKELPKEGSERLDKELYVLERLYKKMYPKSKIKYFTFSYVRKSIPIKTRQLVYEDNIKQYGTLTCVLCGNPIDFGEDSIDHLIPVIRGGTSKYNNLGVAHLKCNMKKHTQTFEEYKIQCEKSCEKSI